MTGHNTFKDETIDEEQFINNIEEVSPDDEITSWNDLDINANLLRGIYSYGFEHPSPIQKKATRPIIQKRDVIAQAQSGTGKTATFAIGLLQSLDLKNDNTQVLVLSPTRELASQTCNVIKELGQYLTNLRIQVQYGGVNNSHQETSAFKSKNDPHVICGCTGRIHDMLKRNKIYTNDIKMVVIDEADEMLSFGFKEQVHNIFQYINENVQVILVSATLPPNVYPIINSIMRNPVKITVRSEMLTLEGISQYYVAVSSDREKYNTLKDLFSNISVSQCIVYCNSIKRVIDLYNAMKEDDFPVTCIHSSMDKQDRDSAFNNFKSGAFRVLISSNVTARGIDIQQVGVVINFDFPQSTSTYLHRIGRSGRWGRKGVGINFISQGDVQRLRDTENYYACQIVEMPNDKNILQF
jgi:superfamily II DNA/RNA helicase